MPCCILPKNPKVKVIFDRYENILYTQSFSIICRDFFFVSVGITKRRGSKKLSKKNKKSNTLIREHRV